MDIRKKEKGISMEVENNFSIKTKKFRASSFFLLPFSFNSTSVKPRNGVTLVELLVVIGIIGVLAGVLMASFSGGTETARSAKCLANIRNLAQGAISYASQHDHYPYAGSHAAIGVTSDGKTKYSEHVGWISWLSMNDEYNTHKRSGRYSTSFRDLPNISACCADDEKSEFAITNGAMWKYVGQNKETYVCPAHALRARRNGVVARFSYAMSARFGYDWSQGSQAVTSDGGGHISFNSSKLDRTLLFSELPFGIPGACDSANSVDASTAYSTSDNEKLTDCVLQYRANVNGKSYNGRWGGTAEAVAFNHKTGKQYCAHVAFADGHVEKLALPKGGGGLNSAQLTALLCDGVDVSFNGSAYNLVTDGDK